MTMKAVEQFHAVTVTLSIRLPLGSENGLLLMTAKAERKMGARGGLLGSVSRSVRIGSANGSQVAADTFRLLYGLDLDCGQMWANEELFESV
jgi:hypothetical protein